MHGYELLQVPRQRCELRCAIAAQRRRRDLDDGENALARVLEHCELFVDPRDKSVAQPMLEVGFWEWWITRAVADCMVPGRVCVDVGANGGYFAALFAALGASEIVAVEPHPDLALRLRRSASHNGWNHLRVIESAVSDHRGTMHLVVRGNDNLGGCFVAPDPLPDWGETTEDLRAIRVPVATLDDLLADSAPIQVIKIDCEGSEPRIWTGMQQVLQRHPDVHVFAELLVNDEAIRWLELLVATGWPLRVVDYDGSLRAITVTEARERQIWMLYLHRDR